MTGAVELGDKQGLLIVNSVAKSLPCRADGRPSTKRI